MGEVMVEYKQALHMKRSRRVLPVVLLLVTLGAGVVYQRVISTSGALVASQNSGEKIRLSQSVWREHQASSVANTPAQLPRKNKEFNVHIGLEHKGANTKPRKFTRIAVGKEHTCALDDTGAAYCWGKNYFVGIGVGEYRSYAPAAVLTNGVLRGKKLVDITVGSRHACALDDAGAAYCWGGGNQGQLGNNVTQSSTIPVAVSAGGVLANKKLVQITAGKEHTCALDDAGAAYCWGWGQRGQLGNADKKNSLVPVAVASDRIFTHIEARAVHTCAVDTTYRVYCWGSNNNKQLGSTNSNSGDATVPAPALLHPRTGDIVFGGQPIASYATNLAHGCLVIEGGTGVYCWGDNHNNRLGRHGVSTEFPELVDMNGALANKKLKQISVGAEHTCALDDAGAAYCWGSGDQGQLGDGANPTASLPVAVKTTGVLRGRRLVQIAAGDKYTCALDDAGAAYCWGQGWSGQLGHGTGGVWHEPMAVASPYGYIPAGSLRLRAQYAEKGQTATCGAVPQGEWQDITKSSALAYRNTPHGSDIGYPQNLPKNAYVTESTVSDVSFTNTRSIYSGHVGVWDLALVNLSLKPSTHYCMRIVTDTAAAPDTAIDMYEQYPEIITAMPDPTLSIDFVDSAARVLTNPTVVFSPTTRPRDVTTTTARLPDIKVTNDQYPSGWNITLAPTAGTGAQWQRADNVARYPFNGTTPQKGQLTVTAEQTNWRASGASSSGRACTTTGLLGGGGTFALRTANAYVITLASAASTVDTNCSFILRDVLLTQTIPRRQAPGTYTLPIAITITAQ